jgi:aryl-alcohol dehydrogenase-like predicted oxidoreductase
VLATKFTNQTDPDDPNSAGNHRKKIVASIEASLRRLQTDHIDANQPAPDHVYSATAHRW